MNDLISRQAAIDALKRISFSHWFECGEYLSEDTREIEIINSKKALEVIEALPSEQPELYKDEVSRQAVEHLDLFAKTYCRDKSVTNDLAFRCKQCDFEMPDGKCLIKTMARKLCPDYKNFGCMGDL